MSLFNLNAAPYEWLIGWRYIRAGRTSQRNRFISFISAFSIMGIALGVAALIIVMSVMNGFQKEVRDKMLGVLAHIEVLDIMGQGFSDMETLRQNIQKHPQVMATAPFIQTQALLARGDLLKGTMIRGIAPALEAQVTQLNLLGYDQSQGLPLRSGEFGVILGMELARQLEVKVGDSVTLVAPAGDVTPVGAMPRLKTLTVVGLLDSGHFEYDATLALLHVDDVAKIFRLTGANGLRLKVTDLHQARSIADTLMMQLGSDYWVRDWTRQNKTYFSAVQLEKRMMFIILTLIIAVAAFNLVSTLVMMVTDKQSDIAILRTLGATKRSILSIFMLNGAISGLLGTLAGLVLGLGVAMNIDVLVPAIEKALGAQFLPKDVYLITRLPSDPQWGDIGPIVIISLILSLVATLYPSWRASRVEPAQALRYE